MPPLALASRFDCEVRVITATQDAHVDLDAARRIAPDLEEHDARALDALTVAAETTDLVVVGSRGLRGSEGTRQPERAARPRSRHSVLVVRPQGDPAA